MPPAHAALFARKLFAARAAVSAAFADVEDLDLSGTHSSEALATRDTLLNGLDRASTGLTSSGPSNNGETLDSFLMRISATRVAGLLANAEASGNPLVADRLRQITDRFSSVDCSACAALAPDNMPPCRARPSDDVVVASCGECIREVTVIFEWALAFASNMYDEALADNPGTMATRVPCLLSTSANNDQLVKANTTFQPSIPQSSVVNVDFPEDATAFDFATFPYVLTHEFICHAYYLALTRSPRVQRGGLDAWSEAWMDCVAFSLLRDHIDRGMPVLTGWPKPFTEVILSEATNRAHEWRYGGPVAPAPAGNALRRARLLFKAMECRIFRCMGADGRKTLFQSLLVLNAHGAPHEVVDVLLANSWCFREGVVQNLGMLSSEEQTVFGALVRYRSHQNPVELLRELLI